MTSLDRTIGIFSVRVLLSPIQIIISGLLLVISINTLMAWYLLQQPHLGYALAADGAKVLIQSTRSNTITQDLSGKHLLAIEGAGKRINVEPLDILAEAEVLPDYPAFHRFFERQTLLTQIINQAQIEFTLEDAPPFRFSPRSTSISDLPMMFWIQVLVADICCLGGLAVWSFRRNDTDIRFYFLVGLSLAISVWPTALYSSRELALDGQTFRLLSALNHLGASLAIATIFGLVWRFPKRLGAFPAEYVALIVMLVHWLMDISEYYPSMDIGTRLVPLSAIVISFALIALHWQRSSDDLIYRQQVKSVLLAGGIGCTPITAFMMAPLFGQPNVLDQGIMTIGYLLVYVGLVFGIFRYRLFDLDRWWFEAWIWVAVALFFILIDFAVISLFHLSDMNAHWLALTLSGWLYLPLRQILMNRLLAAREVDFSAYLPLVVRAISQASTTAELSSAYRQCLLDIFQPMTHTQQSLSAPGKYLNQSAEIAEYGLVLQVPMPDSGQRLELHCAEQGRRLFKPCDITVAHSLTSLFTDAMDAKRRLNQAVNQERERIKEDMHDTLGGRLLSIMREQGEPNSAATAKQAWYELRDILTALEGKNVTLLVVAEQWRQDVQSQARAAGVELDWQFSPTLRERGLEISGEQCINLGQILRELVTNALRHGQTTQLEVGLDYNREQQLELLVINDGVDDAPEHWVTGRGLHHVRKRAEKLGANVVWQQQPDHRVLCHLILPL